MRRRALLSAGLLAVAAAGVLSTPVSATVPPSVTMTVVAQVSNAVDVAWRTGDDAMYVVSQDGTVTRVLGDASTVVLDLTDLTKTNGEMGLLGLTFAAAGDVAYVNYTATSDGNTNVVEFAVDEAGNFDRDSFRLVLLVEQPSEAHNGGRMVFGPDGLLYIGMGDGGPGGDPDRRGQDLTSLLGKLLRIDPSTPSGDLGYTIPADNPYVGTAGARGEIWAIGLRNPWRFSFDRDTGDLWLADVGQNVVEEVDVAPATDGLNAGRGLNFGWSGFEGNEIFNADEVVDDHYPPIFTYTHDEGCSVSGGVRARGAGAGSLAGWFVFSDYCSGIVRAMPVSGAGAEIALGDPVELGQDTYVTGVVGGPDGTVYVLGGSGVSRLDTTAT